MVKSRSTIDGYIRDVEMKSFSDHVHELYRTIPGIVNNLCTEYYHIPKDRFDPKLHDKNKIQITGNRAIIDPAQNTIDRCASAFLSNTVSKGIHHWKFKVVNCNNSYGALIIGIVDISADLTESYSDLFCVRMDKAWGLNFKYGNISGFGHYNHINSYCQQSELGHCGNVFKFRCIDSKL